MWSYLGYIIVSATSPIFNSPSKSTGKKGGRVQKRKYFRKDLSFIIEDSFKKIHSKRKKNMTLA